MSALAADPVLAERFDALFGARRGRVLAPVALSAVSQEPRAPVPVHRPELEAAVQIAAIAAPDGPRGARSTASARATWPRTC